MDWNLFCEHCSVWYGWAKDHWYLYFLLPAAFFALRFAYDVWNWFNWDEPLFPYRDETPGIVIAGLLIWPICLAVIVCARGWELLENFRVERLKRLGRR